MHKIIIGIIFLLAMASVYATQPTQQYNKILLTPFYINAMTQNIQYNYTVNVNTPDGISQVKTAILTLDAWINPTRTFNAWMNNIQCNTANYTISTTYASAGRGVVTFDCTNAILPNQENTVRFVVTGGNIGASTAWLDLTYMNNPQGTTDIFGTEYTEGDDATIFLLLKDASGIAVSNATCIVDIYYPNIANQSHPEWIDNALMIYKEEGLYYYDFTVPLITGLYMVNAQCTYITENNQYYTLESGKSPTRNVTAGTYVGDTFVLNDYQEWLYTQCDSSGGTKLCDAWYQWNITTSSLGNVTKLYVQYLGENSGANPLTLYWWNWSNNSWVALPNTLTFKATGAGGVPSGVDEYLSNEIPIAAIGNGSNTGLVRVRTYTTSGSTFKQWDNWLALRTTRYASVIQDLKGSGEVHVTSAPTGENRFFKVLTCDGFIDGRCDFFTDDAEFDLLEGELEGFLNISATSTKSDISISFNTPFAVDCTALYWIREWNGTDWVDFEDYDLYSQPAYENCIITLHKNIVSGTTYDFWYKMDNYMKWEVDWTKKVSDSINTSVAPLCSNKNFTYDVPITESTPTTNDSITDFCYQFYDDQYWINSYYSDSLGVDIAGEYASYVQEMRYYRNAIFNRYMFLVLGNNTGLMSDYYAEKVWNHPVRNLTYYQNFSVVQQDMTNYTRINEGVWNNSIRNLTYYPPQVDMTNYTRIDETIYAINQSIFTSMLSYYMDILNFIPGLVWNYTDRNLTYYPIQVDLTNYTLINQGVWTYNNRTLTYYEHTDMTNYTLINEGVWAYTTRNLTYYPTQEDLTNYTNVAVNVWTYITRNLTYYPPVSNLTAQDVWEYSNRNLTYYPAQVDLTNYSLINEGVWTYGIRNLTYYEDKTNYTQITDTVPTAVWTYTTRNLTYYPPQVDLTNYTLINEGVSIAVWVYGTRNLTYYPTVSNLTAEDVWTYVTRNLTYYENFTISQIDLTNYSKISNLTALDVWEYINRNLTYYPNMTVNTQVVNVDNVTVITQNVTVQNVTVITQNVTVQNVTVNVQNISVDYGIIASNVWNYTDRNLTYYPQQQDLTNYSLIYEGVWLYNIRNLTYYPAQQDLTNYSLINEGVWTYFNRNLTYYEANNITPSDVWNYGTRNLTYYPVQNDMTNYTLITENVWNYNNRTLTYYEINNITSNEIWGYINRTLTYYEVNNITAQDIWVYNNRTLTYYPTTDINDTAIAETVWNYTARYAHGIIYS